MYFTLKLAKAQGMLILDLSKKQIVIEINYFNLLEYRLKTIDQIREFTVTF